jgi:hypothetical protein
MCVCVCPQVLCARSAEAQVRGSEGGEREEGESVKGVDDGEGVVRLSFGEVVGGGSRMLSLGDGCSA